MKRSKVIAAIVVAVTLVLGVGAALFVLRAPSGPPSGAEGFEPAEAAELVQVRSVQWQPTADLVGTVFALRSVAVRNELAGVVRHVGFESGEEVEAGRIVLRQDDAMERADLAAAEAAVRVAEANITQADSQIALAEVELSRLTGVPSGAIAQVEIDRARTRLDTAKADRGRWLAERDEATAHVAQVHARLAKLTIHAPFRARAGLRTVHEGQYLGDGTDVVVLQELSDRIYLDFAIPQEYAPRVRVGSTVTATAELLGTNPIAITVVAADAQVNTGTRNLRVRAIVDNPAGRLVPGMSVSVRVPIDQPTTHVAVPSTAVRRAAYGNSVFIVSPDPDTGDLRAHQKFVTLGQTLGEDVIVLEGLAPGDQVAAAGSFKLRDGVKVTKSAPGGLSAGADAPARATNED